MKPVLCRSAGTSFGSPADPLHGGSQAPDLPPESPLIPWPPYHDNVDARLEPNARLPCEPHMVSAPPSGGLTTPNDTAERGDGAQDDPGAAAAAGGATGSARRKHTIGEYMHNISVITTHYDRVHPRPRRSRGGPVVAGPPQPPTGALPSDPDDASRQQPPHRRASVASSDEEPWATPSEDSASEGEVLVWHTFRKVMSPPEQAGPAEARQGSGYGAACDASSGSAEEELMTPPLNAWMSDEELPALRTVVAAHVGYSAPARGQSMEHAGSEASSGEASEGWSSEEGGDNEVSAWMSDEELPSLRAAIAARVGYAQLSPRSREASSGEVSGQGSLERHGPLSSLGEGDEELPGMPPSTFPASSHAAHRPRTADWKHGPIATGIHAANNTNAAPQGDRDVGTQAAPRPQAAAAGLRHTFEWVTDDEELSEDRTEEEAADMGPWEHVRMAIRDPSKAVVAVMTSSTTGQRGDAAAVDTCLQSMFLSALRHMDFDYVFTTGNGADVTVLEGASELLRRITEQLLDSDSKAGAAKPLLSSFCPGLLAQASKSHAGLVPHMTTESSPEGGMGSIVKSFCARELGRPPSDVVLVSLVAQAPEPAAEPNQAAGTPSSCCLQDGTCLRDADHVFTNAQMLNVLAQHGVVMSSMSLDTLDEALGFPQGLGKLFSSHGGVMEAAMRTAHQLIAGAPLPCLPLDPVPLAAGAGDLEMPSTLRTCTLCFAPAQEGVLGAAMLRAGLAAEQRLAVGVVWGLDDAERAVQAARRGDLALDVLEVIACPQAKARSVGHKHLFSRHREARPAAAGGCQDAAVQFLCDVFLSRPGSGAAQRLLHPSQ